MGLARCARGSITRAGRPVNGVFSDSWKLLPAFPVSIIDAESIQLALAIEVYVCSFRTPLQALSLIYSRPLPGRFFFVQGWTYAA